MRGERGKPRFSPLQREAIYKLKTEGKTAKQAREILAQGFGELPPFPISADSINRIHREMSTTRETPIGRDLATDTPGLAVDQLFRFSIRIAQAEVERMRAEQAKGRALNLRDFRAWILALRELKRDAADLPGKGAEPPSAPSEDSPGDGLDWLEDAPPAATVADQPIRPAPATPHRKGRTTERGAPALAAPRALSEDHAAGTDTTDDPALAEQGGGEEGKPIEAINPESDHLERMRSALAGA